ncbi:hypothetical protein [Aneurinibacillus tyrosinisolvens]|uniref:hypothetical protein n=1 Tax=Aneurinibacillus tyrosinisolvens TaxID=1443435 RepID=UPI00063F8E81|nr:hypothetical protein [Aneurinibacillus tyrosinisolvens]
MKEIILTSHTQEQWRKRRQELTEWNERPKQPRRAKALLRFASDYVDEEMHPALALLNQLGIKTEYSCAGVSVLDDPESHSLYAYVTFPKTNDAEPFMQFLIKKMRHRLLAIYEPERNRYDLSSFYIGHNRSFCLLLYRYTLEWKEYSKRV